MVEKNASICDIIDHITNISNFSERLEAFRFLYQEKKYFKTFIDLTLLCEDKKFTQLEEFEPKNSYKKYASAKTSIITSQELVDKWLPKLMDSSTIKAHAKKCLISSLIDEIPSDDVSLIIGLLKGKYVGDPKLNKIFVETAVKEKKLI